ncbi:hypothetical protein [Tautonia sociabilis]|uniref:Uncharacterized protein n=1 Tax=Tautonia sociabilis TaxID=2080755 RepID=A0A432MEI9_9BACT|nr:hypothetical protein [Tautonia sociabilis]RUL83887.1 hypothetical protein TsocGM_21415 [Tautonia sociabilis]
MRRVLVWSSEVALAMAVAVVSGCGGESGDPGAASGTGGGISPPPPPRLGQGAPPPPVAAQPEAPQLRRVIGQKTTDVRDFQTEMQGGENVRVSSGTISPDSTPITYAGNAYVSIVGQAAVLQIQHALNLYNAMNDRYPADTDEFMREIIQANGIALPQLPGYQEYAYNPETHELVVLEYPDRKEALRAQVRGERP